MANDSRITAIVTTGKDIVSLLRDFTLFGLVLLLMAFPATFNSILERAGFEEGSLAGMKWRSKLVASDAALKEARAAIGDLQKKNDEISNALTQISQATKDPAVKGSIVSLKQDTKWVQATAKQAQASVSTTIASSAPLVSKVLSAKDGPWAVVWSGDATLASAKYETDVEAPKLQLTNPAVFFRQGSYRSVALAGEKQIADQLLIRARGRRSDAYIVNMSTWCPSEILKDGYKACTGF
jgi:hypothetical protein